MSAKKKVSAIVRADDLASLRQFNNSYKPKWFYIPKGDNIRIVDRDVYFDHVAEDVTIETRKVIIIGYTSEIVMVGLIPTESLKQFPDAIKVKEFKLRL
jgi:hypothetical protein